MNFLVTYYTRTGNTRMLANAIKNVLESKKISYDYTDIKDLNTKELSKYDAFFVGSPCHSSNITPKIKHLLYKISKLGDKKVFLFVTHGANKTGKYYDRWASRCEETYKKIISPKNQLGYYHCQGKPEPLAKLFIKYVIFYNKKKEWIKEEKEMIKHPDKKDLEKVREQANKIIKKLS